MLIEVKMNEIKTSKNVKVFYKEENGINYLIEPIDYYGQPLYQVRKDPEGGYLVKGQAIPFYTDAEKAFYARRAKQKWYMPLLWDVA